MGKRRGPTSAERAIVMRAKATKLEARARGLRRLAAKLVKHGASRSKSERTEDE